MLSIKYNGDSGIVEFIPESNGIRDNISMNNYGFIIEMDRNNRQLGHDTYFKMYKINKLIPSAIKATGIFFTRNECIKLNTNNWKLDKSNKISINNYLDKPVMGLDKNINNNIYHDMTIYNFLIFLANKLYLGEDINVTDTDIQLVQKSILFPMLVTKDFLSVYYVKPDFSTMEYFE